MPSKQNLGLILRFCEKTCFATPRRDYTKVFKASTIICLKKWLKHQVSKFSHITTIQIWEGAPRGGCQENARNFSTLKPIHLAGSDSGVHGLHATFTRMIKFYMTSVSRLCSARWTHGRVTLISHIAIFSKYRPQFNGLNKVRSHGATDGSIYHPDL